MKDRQSTDANHGVLTTAWPARVPPTRTTASGSRRAYVRFATLGDSSSCTPGGGVGASRDWASALVEAMSHENDVSFCALAASGATIDDLLGLQLPEAIAHRPQMASMIIGLDEITQVDWDQDEIREGLLRCADELAWRGTALLTVLFHDHSRILGIPRSLARPMRQRIDELNEVYGQIHQDYESIQVDLRTEPAVYDRRFWSADRRHPSIFGHDLLASRFAEQLSRRGLALTSSPPAA